MSYARIKAFLKVVDRGSITRAAEDLGYTQSAVSQMLRSLETEWGVTLLTRDRAGVRLSSEGLQLLPFLQKTWQTYQDLQNEIAGLHNLQKGLIRVGMLTSVATQWMPQLLKSFQESYPNIDFELRNGDYTEIAGWILDGQVDCGFLCLPTTEDIEGYFLHEDSLLVLLAEDHPLAGCDVFPVEQLATEPFIRLKDAHDA
ncbi:LysR family transcriptional regulator, partial [Ruminococcaceae bacterium OttesenSCG-928-I18]|nr:LysR family transcriptional regulator [Ruminococcaceae bacterium OttesenSCG-928-I18]